MNSRKKRTDVARFTVISPVKEEDTVAEMKKGGVRVHRVEKTSAPTEKGSSYRKKERGGEWG